MAPLFRQLAFWCTESFPSEQALIHSAAPLYILRLAIPKKIFLKISFSAPIIVII